jgi:DNA repair protein RadC
MTEHQYEVQDSGGPVRDTDLPVRPKARRETPPTEPFGLREVVGIIIGERLMRRWFPKYPKRPDHYFDAYGRPHVHGHRERLRQRFMATWPDGLPDYELLELILFNAVERIDVKPLAKKLLAEFGDFNAVVAAPEQRLLRIKGVNKKVVVQLRLVEATARRLARGELADRCLLSSQSALIAYCRTAMAYRDVEQLRVLYLDQKNRLILDEERWRGTVNAAPMYPREVVRRALELNAVAIIIVHNHPSGDTEPSDADLRMTRELDKACRTVGIKLHDHVVIGQTTETSFRARRLL